MVIRARGDLSVRGADLHRLLVGHVRVRDCGVSEESFTGPPPAGVAGILIEPDHPVTHPDLLGTDMAQILGKDEGVGSDTEVVHGLIREHRAGLGVFGDRQDPAVRGDDEAGVLTDLAEPVDESARGRHGREHPGLEPLGLLGGDPERGGHGVPALAVHGRQEQHLGHLAGDTGGLHDGRVQVPTGLKRLQESPVLGTVGHDHRLNLRPVHRGEPGLGHDDRPRVGGELLKLGPGVGHPAGGRGLENAHLGVDAAGHADHVLDLGEVPGHLGQLGHLADRGGQRVVQLGEVVLGGPEAAGVGTRPVGR